MPAFDFAPLAWWGLPLVAAPVLIHLINLLRHRRVRWAAMELLLASQKKYKTRILLKQLLLEASDFYRARIQRCLLDWTLLPSQGPLSQRSGQTSLQSP